MPSPDKLVPAPAKAIPAPNSPKNVTPASAALTRKQRNALFDAASKGMKPLHQKKTDDPLHLWASQVLKKHREGFSPRQIVLMARSPGINLNLSVRSVQRLISEHEKPAANASTAAGETLKT